MILKQKALEFLAAYLIELSLSIDNVFVFYLIFSYFKVDLKQQVKILSWGILGAQLMRAVFILGGIAFLKRFSWLGFVFGFFVMACGIRLFVKGRESGPDLERNFLLRFLKSRGVPLFFIVLIAVETADLVFAVDSIPTVLAVTRDPLVAYSSNILAIMGLRAMYVFLASAVGKFRYLHFALGVILLFVGGKMVLEPILTISTVYVLAFIVIILAVFAFFSLRKERI